VAVTVVVPSPFAIVAAALRMAVSVTFQTSSLAFATGAFGVVAVAVEAMLALSSMHPRLVAVAPFGVVPAFVFAVRAHPRTDT
jgi:hypothetical protein